jgi:hypothetical protein
MRASHANRRGMRQGKIPFKWMAGPGSREIGQLGEVPEHEGAVTTERLQKIRLAVQAAAVQALGKRAGRRTSQIWRRSLPHLRITKPSLNASLHDS